MKNNGCISKWKCILQENLLNNIIPFWDKMKDDEHGAFYGMFKEKPIKDAIKGAIYTSRLLWSFSKLYQKYKMPRHLEYIKDIFEFTYKYMYDKEKKGMYWSVDYKGDVVDPTKHLYTQGFYIYGLSEYYQITKDDRALKIMKELTEIIREKLIDFPNNYYEQYDRNWNRQENDLLIGYGMVPDITSNTILHLIEPLSTAYYITKDSLFKEVNEKLISIFFNYMFDDKNLNLYQFLDRNLNNVVEVRSYGHNIETSWLFTKLFKDIGYNNDSYLKTLKELGLKTLEEAFNGEYLNYELLNNKVNTSTIWWVQAETLVCMKYLNVSDDVISKLVKHIKDELMTSGEWIWGLDEEKKEFDCYQDACMWKANYHNVRAILEVLE